jgi:hypothetical protein
VQRAFCSARQGKLSDISFQYKTGCTQNLASDTIDISVPRAIATTPITFSTLRDSTYSDSSTHSRTSQRLKLRSRNESCPTGYDDIRAADNWRPLLAIADEAGGEWPGRARQAALNLAGADGAGEEDRSLLLLAGSGAVNDLEPPNSKRADRDLLRSRSLDALSD